MVGAFYYIKNAFLYGKQNKFYKDFRRKQK